MLCTTSLSNYFVCAVLLPIFLVTFKHHAVALGNHDGFSSATVTENDICSDIFNHQQCTFMQSVIKTVINKMELDFKKQIKVEISERRKDKLLFEREKLIFVNQITHIRQEVKTVKLQLKQSLHTQSRYVNIDKHTKQQKNKSLADVEPLLSYHYDDYDWENSIHYGDDEMANRTSKNLETFIESVRGFPEMNNGNDMDNWKKIATFLEDLIPLIGTEEVKPDKTGEFSGRSYPYEYGPNNLINFGSRLMRAVNKIQNGFSQRQSDPLDLNWPGVNWPYLLQKVQRFLQNQRLQNRQDIVGSLGSLLSTVAGSSGVISTVGLVAVGAVSGVNLYSNVNQENNISDLESKINAVEGYDDTAVKALITALGTRVTTAETAITALELLASNTGSSLKSLCKGVDSSTYSCCVNENNNKMRCFTPTIINLVGTSIGISTTNGAGTCDDATSSTSTALICQGD